MLNLADIRTKLDQIDRSIINHLRDRADLVEQVVKAKGKQKLYIKPRREITMMEPLLDQAEDKLHRSYIWKTWRELIGYFTTTEGPISLSVEESMWDLARDHYGYRTPLEKTETSSMAVETLIKGQHTVAVLPLPEEPSKNPWWVRLAQDSTHRIFTLVPRIPETNAIGNPNGGVSVATLTPNATGNDISYIAARTTIDMNPNDLKAILPLSENVLSLTTITDKELGPMALIKLNTHVLEEDIKSTDLPKEVKSLHYLGGYCVPPKL